MAVRESIFKVYLQSYLPLTIFLFIMDFYPGHNLESTKGIEVKLGL